MSDDAIIQIAEAAGYVLAVGMAVFLVYVAVAVERWLKRTL
jgi:hypothetical protein